MIRFTEKNNCCGCSACEQRCPKHCIKMQEDEEGFLYPEIDPAECIDCRICEKVCPFEIDLDSQKPLITYAAINPDTNERINSSSGGIFSLLARKVLQKGGVVFGASFDRQWKVCHKAVERESDLYLFRGSKYVQSRIDGAYQEAKEFLNRGRIVLFSGTACQIAGLRLFLMKDYENLLTVDVVCHGVPSPRVWDDYVRYLRRAKGTINDNNTIFTSQIGEPEIDGISFRDKQEGWKKYAFVVRYSAGQKEPTNNDNSTVETIFEVREPMSKNVYMQGFLNNLFLRPSCHMCKVKGGRCGSDITLGDFWGIRDLLPEIDDDKGVSLSIANTRKGKAYINSVGAYLFESEYRLAAKYNPSLEQSVAETKYRSMFWASYYNENEEVVQIILRILQKMKPSFLKRLVSHIESYVIQLLRKNKN